MDSQLPELCQTHNVAMIREQEHVGDGKTRWSQPYCPACREIASREQTRPAEAGVAGPDVGSKIPVGAEA